MQFDLIAAVDENWGLSKNGRLPWSRTEAGREDMDWFREVTTETDRTAVIMGRKTYESIPPKFRPLPRRINVVISSAYNDGITTDGILTDEPVVHVKSFKTALEWCASAGVRAIVIGGANVYEQALQSPFLRIAYITMIKGDFACDLKFPSKYLNHYDTCNDCKYENGELVPKKNEYRYYYFGNIEEAAYQRMCSEVLKMPPQPNRTGIDTRAKFATALRFSLFEQGRGNILPLITSKHTPFSLIYHELIWFLRGSTDTDYLLANNVHIWDGNSSREFLDANMHTQYQVGEVGPIYGKQWRSWGSTWWWKSCRKEMELKNADKPNIGYDQLAAVIYKLKTDPYTRRAVVNAWNVEDLPEMVLPPCHYSFQFVVNSVGGKMRLNCSVNMRSADLALGVPFNIASYALLTHMVAHIVGMTPGELNINMADCHLYENHIAGVEKMIARQPRRFPTIAFSPRVHNTKDVSIDDFANNFTINDIVIGGYSPHPTIKLPMAV